MRYIETFTDGMNVRDIYYCRAKTSAMTKNGKEYLNLTLQDKTGQIDSKIWSPSSPSIRDFEAYDFVLVEGRVQDYKGTNQLNIIQISRAEPHSYDPEDYFPTSSYDQDLMRSRIMALIDSVGDEYLRRLLLMFFGDQTFLERFMTHSAAKSIHHGFIGGLPEHSLSVAGLCDLIASHYGDKVNRDLLISGALLHDIGKCWELSDFPTNDYTDEGQLIGHIVIGARMVMDACDRINGFPKRLRNELTHLILSHHGEYEFGSPKKPALIEAIILASCDNMDAKVETMYEAITSRPAQNDDGWLGFQKTLDSNIRRTSGTDYR